jgi:CRISPR-associated endonuclease/helicase Cas3
MARWLLAFVIAGHHAGLANGTGEDGTRSALDARLKKVPGHDIPGYAAVATEIALLLMPRLPPLSLAKGRQALLRLILPERCFPV